MHHFKSFALACIFCSTALEMARAQQEPDKSAKPEAKDPTLIKKIAVGDDVYAAHWSGDGRIMTTMSARKKKDENDVESPKFITTRIWDAQSGKMLHSLGELNVPGYHYHYVSYDGSTLVIREPRLLSKELQIWDIVRGELVRRTPIEPGGPYLYTVAMTRDAKMMAQLFLDTLGAEVEKRSGSIELFDTTTGKKLQTLREETANPRSAVFSPDGKSLITSNSKSMIRVWDVQTGKVVREAQASLKSASYDLSLSPDGKTLIIPSKGIPLQVWDVTTLKTKKDIETPFLWMFGAAFSEDGKLAAISGRKENSKEYGLLVWNLEKHELVREWDPGARYFAFLDNDLAVLDNGEVKIHRFKL